MKQLNGHLFSLFFWFILVQDYCFHDLRPYRVKRIKRSHRFLKIMEILFPLIFIISSSVFFQYIFTPRILFRLL